MAKISTIEDELNGTARKTAIWSDNSSTGGVMSYSSSGATATAPNPNVVNAAADLLSVNSFDLVDSYVMVKVTQVSGASATHTLCRLQAGNATNRLTIDYQGGTLSFNKRVSSADTQVASVSYDAVAHLWWRLRESNGTSYWETSPDSIGWTVRASQANPITLTGLIYIIGIFADTTGGDTTMSPMIFSNFNKPTGLPQNYQQLKVGDGLSVSERIR